MHVELRHEALLLTSKASRRLADGIDSAVRTSSSASPIYLSTLPPVSAKAQWLREQVAMLSQLGALALMLDTDGNGTSSFEFTGSTWNPETLLNQAADQRFGPGFVEATGLEGEELTALLLTLGSVGQDLPDNPVLMTPAQLRQFIIDHPQVATALQGTRPFGPGPASTLHSLTLPFMTNPGGAAEVWDQRRLDARSLFESMSAEDAAIFAMTYPSIVGNLPGVPFDNRADANTVNVVAAMADEQTELGDMREQHQHNQHDWDFWGSTTMILKSRSPIWRAALSCTDRSSTTTVRSCTSIRRATAPSRSCTDRSAALPAMLG